MRTASLRVFRALRLIVLYLYLPITAVLVLIHYPYSTDPDIVEARSGQNGSAGAFYEAAYRGLSSATRGLSYEETAAQAAKDYDIEGQIRNFVTNHGLEDKRVLEIGSGRGYLQDAVADYTGLDLSPSVAPNYHKPFVVGSATAMPFDDNTFDAAWTVWVVEHISTPEKAFEEMRRVVRPGGLLLLVVAWNCPPWLADGFAVRPYSDFNGAGKLVKASVSFRQSFLFSLTDLLPIRLARVAHYGVTDDATRLGFRRLHPNYDVYWQADSDAAVPLDQFETILWFRSRGDACLSCGSTVGELFRLGQSLVIRLNKG